MSRKAARGVSSLHVSTSKDYDAVALVSPHGPRTTGGASRRRVSSIMEVSNAWKVQGCPRLSEGLSKLIGEGNGSSLRSTATAGRSKAEVKQGLDPPQGRFQTRPCRRAHPRLR